MQNEKLKYFIYCRKSKEDEGSHEQILSIKSQKNLLSNLVNQKKLNIVEVLTENKTAFKPGRPIFNEMIKRIENKEANALLVWKLDRLSRNPIDTGQLVYMLDQGKLLEIHTVYHVK